MIFPQCLKFEGPLSPLNNLSESFGDFMVTSQKADHSAPVKSSYLHTYIYIGFGISYK